MNKLIVLVGFLSLMEYESLNSQGILFQKLQQSPADCDRPPIINCPVDFQTLPGANTDPKVMGCATARPATALCQEPIIEYRDRILSTGPCPGSKSIQRIWTATDPTDPNLRSFCIQYIRLADTLAPIFTNCPTDTSILTNSKCVGYFSWIMPSVTDQSGEFCMKSSHINGNEFPIGTTTIIFTATDACGNSSQCTFNLTVISNCCTSPPTIQCPNSYLTCTDEPIDPTVAGFPIVEASSPICRKPLVKFRDSILVDNHCIKNIIRRWIATDQDNPSLLSECFQTIIQSDQEPPIIGCPPNVTVESASNCRAIVSWRSPTISDNCPGSITVNSTHQSGDSFPLGETTVVYTVLDDCGNSSTCEFIITVTENCCDTIPVIICPSDFTSCPGAIPEPNVSGFAITFSLGNCPLALISYTDQIIFATNCSTRVERKWTARDTVTQFENSCIQIISLVDLTPPSINCNNEIRIETDSDCLATVNWPIPGVTDNCNGTVRMVASRVQGQRLPAGTYPVNYIATDECGNSTQCNFEIIVIENCCKSNPIISCPGVFRVCPGIIPDPSISGVAIATPGSPICLTPLLSYRDSLLTQTTCGGSLLRIWTATDPIFSNLQASCIQEIIFEDITPPSINCNNEIRIETDSDCLATVNWPIPGVTDNCNGAVSMIASRAQGQRLPAGTYPVNYIATDACGNTTQCNFEIIVIENCCKSNPIISCPGVFRVCPGIIPDPSISGVAFATPGSPICLTPLLTYRDSLLNHITCGGSLLRIWTAIDPIFSNLRASCIQEIIFEDITSPVINCPPNITVQSDPDCFVRVNWNDPVITDNCSGNISLTSSPVKGTSIGLGITTVTLFATDACNNVSSCSFTITVNEFCCNLPPTIICPDNYQTCPAGPIEPVNSGIATAQKGHPSCEVPIVSFADQIIFSSRCITIIERTWTAQDPLHSALKSSCIQVISKADTSPPNIIRCPPDITIDPAYNCIATASWVPPVFDDNCGIFTIVSSHSSGSSFDRGTTVVSYTALDSCGNSATCSFKITVTDNCCDKFPIITCPANYISCPGTSLDPIITGSAIATAGKLGCLEPVVSYRDSVVTNGPCAGERKIVRIWVAQDPIILELRTQCYQLIELKDTEVPRFTNFPSNIIIEANGKCEAVVDWDPPIATDNCGIDRVISSLLPGEIVGPGTTVVTYTAFDNCGLTKTDSFTISLVDTEVSIICPPDLTVVQRDPYKTSAIVNWNLPTVSYCQECLDSIPGFIYMGELNGHRYFCSLNAEEWTTARLICEQVGGRLAVINSKDENNFLTSKLNGLTAWIGLTDERIEGRFEWADRSSLRFTAWYPGQPDNSGNQDYVELRPDATWNDEIGRAYREFICEIPCYELKQITGPEIGTLIPCGEHTIQYEATKDEKRDTCSFSLTVTCDSTDRYCRSKGQNSSLMWINTVRLKSIQNTSGNNGGYAFFDQPCAEISSEEEIELCVEPGFLSAIYNLYYKIWIDFNGDFNFDPVTEELFHGYGNSMLCGTVRLPAGLPKKLTRMRISMAFGNYPISPCSPILFGEVEDYCIAMNGATGFGGDEKFQLRSFKTGILKDVMDMETKVFNPQSEVAVPDWEVIVYPNPGNDWINIISSNGMISEYKIFDHQAKTIFQSANSQQGIQLQSANWPEGIYTIILLNQNGKQICKRFTIQR